MRSRQKCEDHRSAGSTRARSAVPAMRVEYMTPPTNQTSCVEPIPLAFGAPARKPRDGSGTVYLGAWQAQSLKCRSGFPPLRIRCREPSTECCAQGRSHFLRKWFCHTRHSELLGCACAPLRALTGTFGASRRLETPEEAGMLSSILRQACLQYRRLCDFLIHRRIVRAWAFRAR